MVNRCCTTDKILLMKDARKSSALCLRKGSNWYRVMGVLFAFCRTKKELPNTSHIQTRGMLTIDAYFTNHFHFSVCLFFVAVDVVVFVFVSYFICLLCDMSCE